MKTTKNLIIVAAMLAGSLGAASAQDFSGAYSGNLNSNGDLAGKSYKGSPGGAKTSPVGHSYDDGADSGIWNTTNSLAGIETGRGSGYVR